MVRTISRRFPGALRIVILACMTVPLPCRAAEPAPAVYMPAHAPFLERLAAREIRRYLFLRTGRLLRITEAGARLDRNAAGILVGRRDATAVRALARQSGIAARVARIGRQSYLIRTVAAGRGRVVLIAGGDSVGTLYGAYRFAELQGVGFGLHGDTIPDRRVAFSLPWLDDAGAPLFALRGIQPFHDFPEGPDWWSTDDYLAVVDQLPKLRMNFLGLHTYPEPIAEPTVWIGRESDVAAHGAVGAGYPASYQNTLRGDWGYAPVPTGDFLFGASLLFERDAYGAEVMRDLCPKPASPEQCVAMFDRTAGMLRAAFTEARALGVRTCVGTETPLVVPDQVRRRLSESGVDPRSPGAIRDLYRGIFRRIAAAYPLDYYWLWTPEGWTWEGVKPAQVAATMDDLQSAFAAARDVGAPFALGTCGWVLGPPGDRAAFARALPAGAPMSCINRQVGNEPVDPAFAHISGRPKWAIPWLEDDPGLSAPQLWAGRMRRDALDARRYGCTGLMGIHWRTRVLAPNVGALAAAAWDQRGWSRHGAPRTEPVGGQAAAFLSHRIAGCEPANQDLYRTVRYGLTAYRIALPDGRYRVTLRFCEPHYGAPGKRVFDVSLHGRRVIQDLDIFARVGQDHALDFTFPDVPVRSGTLEIGFGAKVEFPSIAAIAVEGPRHAVRINCGGGACGLYSPDAPAATGDVQTADWYREWAAREFGAECGPEAARVFEQLDGRLPRPVEWTNGPGGLRPDERPWATASKEYGFVARFEALRVHVRGPGDRERFDYWLANFRYMRDTARLRCLWAEFDRAITAAGAAGAPSDRSTKARTEALPAYRAIVRQVSTVYKSLLATVSTTGELGTVANWEQHILPDVLGKTKADLEALLGEPLPADARPDREYQGPLRITVLPPRTRANAGEPVNLKALVLSRTLVRNVSLQWRPLGRGPFRTESFTHVARGVYTARLPVRNEDIEYRVTAATVDGAVAQWPASAPAFGQTLVVTEHPAAEQAHTMLHTVAK